MLRRFITGSILLFLGIVLIYLGSVPFLLWILLVSFLCAFELLLMFKKIGHKPFHFLVSIIVGMVFISLVPLSIRSYFPILSEKIFVVWQSPAVKIIVLGLILFYFIEIILKRIFIPKNNILANIRISLFIIGTFPFIYLLRIGKNGLMNMLFCCSLIWVSDIAAFFGGKFWGKHKLTGLSPNKTIEGSITAIIGSIVWAAAFSVIFDLKIYLYIIMSIIISTIAQLGDLHESLTKRHFNLKDSSNFLPGHGGIYDRADSTLFVMPLMFYFFN